MNNTKKNRIRRTVTGMVAAVMMMTTVSTAVASADNTVNAVTGMSTSAAMNSSGRYLYHGKEIIEGSYKVDGSGSYSFKYSDGLFSTDPKEYNTHMATMSCAMAHASCTNVVNGDYSKGAEDIESILTQIGFKDIFVNEDYKKKPTVDSVGCAIATKEVNLENGVKRVISVTIRSANYEAEWTSNVTLGKTGEAKGFADSADKVFDLLADYTKDHPEIAADIEAGKAAFWFQGFSRGGAIANLTAKRTIDNAQPFGCKVYAYCIEAPQGGVASEEIKGRDYTSIHNVINPDDLVPYVAPTEMGFKRYGVDHYLNGSDAAEIKTGTLFKNNLCDNSYEKTVSKERLELVKKHIAEIVGADKVGDHAPYAAVNKELDIDAWNRTAEIKNAGGTPVTSELIKNTFADICKNVSREKFVSKDYENALRRLMIFNNTGSGLKAIMKVLDVKELAVKVVKDLYTVPAVTLGLMVAFPILAPTLLGNFIASTPLPTVSNFLDAAKKILNEDSSLKAVLKNYQNGADQAINDIYNLASAVLPSFDGIDAMVTFAVNAGELIRNHSFIQTAAWLRSYDSWFEDTVDDNDTTYEPPVSHGTFMRIDWTDICFYGCGYSA